MFIASEFFVVIESPANHVRNRVEVIFVVCLSNFVFPKHFIRVSFGTGTFLSTQREALSRSTTDAASRNNNNLGTPNVRSMYYKNTMLFVLSADSMDLCELAIERALSDCML